MTAARTLHRRGVEVIVLEAADRVGGRAMSETTILGSRVDLGGQWIGHDHHRLTALAADFGLTPFPMHTGRFPAVVSGSRRLSPIDPSMIAAGLVLAGVEVLSRTGTPSRWNDTTVQQWLARVPGRTARRLLEVLALVSWTADLDRLSIQAMSTMIRSQGGLRNILSTGGGAQEFLLTEGVGTLVDGLAGELGARVRCGQRVTSISRGEGGVTVRTSEEEIHAAKVIVTVPAPMQRHIAFEPALPPSRTALNHNTYMGSVYKAIAIYARSGEAATPPNSSCSTTPAAPSSIPARPAAPATCVSSPPAPKPATSTTSTPPPADPPSSAHWSHISAPKSPNRPIGTKRPGTVTNTQAAAASPSPNPAPPTVFHPSPPPRWAISIGPEPKPRTATPATSTAPSNRAPERPTKSWWR